MTRKNILNKQIIHFIGIGGIGMSGIAELMHKLGYKVQGSDITSNNTIKRLRKKNIKVIIGHRAKNIRFVNAIIYSSAIKKNNIEIVTAKKKSIPIVSRADMLAELMKTKNSIAIAGSHGKTTTTSLVGTILQECKKDPTIINGGIINSFSSNNRYGLGQWMVAEADESDGSFLRLPHEINIITNIDSEHLDYYTTFENLFLSFKKFATNIPFYGYSIICIEDKITRQLVKKIETRKVLTYGIDKKNADLNIINIYKVKNYSYFSIKINNNEIYTKNKILKFKLKLIGRHNILNATASICVSLLLNLPIKKIKLALTNFSGVKRRFTYLGKIKKANIYDDYAHHPTEIKATMETAKYVAKKNIVVIFQPHRYSRTKNLYLDFLKVLKNIDTLFVCDIYAAGEKPIPGINSSKIVKDLRKLGSKNVYYKKRNENINFLLSPYFLKENTIIFMGAGSISQWAYDLIGRKIDS